MSTRTSDCPLDRCPVTPPLGRPGHLGPARPDARPLSPRSVYRAMTMPTICCFRSESNQKCLASEVQGRPVPSEVGLERDRGTRSVSTRSIAYGGPGGGLNCGHSWGVCFHLKHGICHSNLLPRRAFQLDVRTRPVRKIHLAADASSRTPRRHFPRQRRAGEARTAIEPGSRPSGLHLRQLER